MVPVVVGCVAKDVGLLAIERRNFTFTLLYRLESVIYSSRHRSADSGAHTRKSLLIETHSEHIILRLLRRIREKQQKATYRPVAPSLSADALSVIDVESDDDGVRFRQLGIDEAGEFRDQWPKASSKSEPGNSFDAYGICGEPKAIGSSFETFRYVIEQFGFDRGRPLF